MHTPIFIKVLISVSGMLMITAAILIIFCHNTPLGKWLFAIGLILITVNNFLIIIKNHLFKKKSKIKNNEA